MSEPRLYGGSGWFGLVREKRVCAGCGERLTLAHSGALWFDEYPEHRVWHHACRVAAIRALASVR